MDAVCLSSVDLIYDYLRRKIRAHLISVALDLEQHCQNTGHSLVDPLKDSKIERHVGGLDSLDWDSG
jgi:hypothetical protein